MFHPAKVFMTLCSLYEVILTMKSRRNRRSNLIILLVFVFGIMALLGVSNYSFQRACSRRETRWPDLGTADVLQYEILTEAYKIKNEPNRTVTITASDGAELVGHYYERKQNAPIVIFFHGLWSNSYTNGVPIYRITKEHGWNLLLVSLRAHDESGGNISTLGTLERYDCCAWANWAKDIRNALLAGKHVLCESPIALECTECEGLYALAKEQGKILMEAIKTAYSTAYERLVLLAKSGKIGKVVSVDAVCTSLREGISREGVDLTYKWNSMCDWAPIALLPVFQILGVDYRKK